jgi:hypothetical protein
VQCASVAPVRGTVILTLSQSLTASCTHASRSQQAHFTAAITAGVCSALFVRSLARSFKTQYQIGILSEPHHDLNQLSAPDERPGVSVLILSTTD